MKERPELVRSYGDEAYDLTERETVRNRTPRGPKRFTGKRVDGGIELTIVDRGRIASELELSGTSRYHVYWAADVDMTTQDGIDAGFARAVVIASPNAVRKEDHEIRIFVGQQSYQRGYFYCTGANDTSESAPGEPLNFNDTNLDGRTPADVTHWQVTESGEAHNGTVFSRLDFSAVAPEDVRNFAGIQLVYKDYPAVGQYAKGEFIPYRGDAGGSVVGFVRLPIARRTPTGSITFTFTDATVTGAGTTFLTSLQSGDIITVPQYTDYTSYTVDSITSNTELELTAAWAEGAATYATKQWEIFAVVRVHAVSIGYDGSQREDVENAPYVDVLLDGILSPPNAPSSVDAYPYADLIRVEFPQVTGLEIAAYDIYRTTGSTDFGYGTGTLIAHLKHEGAASDVISSTTNRIYDDSDFTVYQKENNQVFRYYVYTVNARGYRSSTYATDTAACQLTPNQGGDPTIPARSGAKTLLYNAGFAGTAGGNVDVTDVPAQQGFNGIAVPAGWTYWDGPNLGNEIWRNGNEVEITFPGAATGTGFFQDISAWSHAANRKVPKGGLLTLQVLIKTSGSPNGSAKMYVEQWDSAGPTNHGAAPRRYRNSGTDAIAYYAIGANSELTIACSDLSTDWTPVYCVLKLDSSKTTTEIRVNFRHHDSTQGSVWFTKPMLSLGEELANWTGEMVDTTIQYGGTGTPPGPIDDSSGKRLPILDAIP